MANNPHTKITAGGSLSPHPGGPEILLAGYYCGWIPAGHGVVDMLRGRPRNMALQFRLECQGKVKIGPYELTAEEKTQNSSDRTTAGFGRIRGNLTRCRPGRVLQL